MPTDLKVLHIEDNPTDARLLLHMLAHEGQAQIEVTQVKYMSDAKQQLRDHHYHVALMDLMLPDAEGLASILSLQADAPLLPIVVYTGLPGLEMAREAILAGAEDYAVKGQTDAVTLVRKLYTAIDRHQLKRTLYGQLATLTSENEVLHGLSHHDPLTCLFNRRGLEQRLQSFLKPEATQAYAILMDLDGFKSLNDRFGRYVGDQVLQEVARALVDCSGGLTALARIGGDEFLSVGIGGKAEAEAQCQSLRQALKASPALSRLIPGFALSGCQAITRLGQGTASLEAGLERAYAALAFGKTAGKDQVIGQWEISGETLGHHGA